MEKIEITCENIGRTLQVDMGTSLQEIVAQYLPKGQFPILAAYVDNRIKELAFRVFSPSSIRFIDITHFEGMRVYQRTLFFILQKAVLELYPSRSLFVRHSLGGGFYCEVEGQDEFSDEQTELIRHTMERLIRSDYKITRHKVLTDQAYRLYAELGFADKIALLNTRKRLYAEIYEIDGLVGYFYGALAPSTAYISLFDIKPYYNGFYIALPARNNPSALSPIIHQDKIFEIFQEHKQWVEVMGVQTVGLLNARILDGESSDLIKIAEAFQEKRLAYIADSIHNATSTRDVRLVLVSGPSSSGKTTFAKRLGIQLSVLGLHPVLISLDDYFVERDRTPKDANGNYDYEALEAIDIDQFNRHLTQLLGGEKVDIPRYNFITGKREWHETPLQLSERSVLIVEGIHGLNPHLTHDIDEHYKYKIYVSCFTSVAMDNLTRINTTDNRLLRRIVRDYTSRGNNATATLARWGSVRRGEERHIFPYQENADVMFNSSLFYEIPVLKPYAERLLREVTDNTEEYGEAKRLLKFLDNFATVSPEEIPPTSILREFIGGSSFKY